MPVRRPNLFASGGLSLPHRIRVRILEERALEPCDFGEYGGFRAVDARIPVHQLDEIAHPAAEQIAFVQLHPAAVRRHLLDDTRIHRALGPG